MFYTLRRWVLVRKRLHKLRAGVNFFFFFHLARDGKRKCKGSREEEERGGRRTGKTDTTYEPYVQCPMMTETHCTKVDSILWRCDERMMSKRRRREIYTLFIANDTSAVLLVFALQIFNADR